MAVEEVAVEEPTCTRQRCNWVGAPLPRCCHQNRARNPFMTYCWVNRESCWKVPSSSCVLNPGTSAPVMSALPLSHSDERSITQPQWWALYHSATVMSALSLSPSDERSITQPQCLYSIKGIFSFFVGDLLPPLSWPSQRVICVIFLF